MQNVIFHKNVILYPNIFSVPYLEQVIILANSLRYNDAARACVDAFEAATSDEDHVILKYSRAMMLLLTKCVQNVEEGFKELQELLESDRMDWKSEFPAIYYGLGMCIMWTLLFKNIFNIIYLLF